SLPGRCWSAMWCLSEARPEASAAPRPCDAPVITMTRCIRECSSGGRFIASELDLIARSTHARPVASLSNVPVTAPVAAKWPEVWVGPVRVHDIRRGEIIDELAADAPEPRLIANLNAHALNLAYKDTEFRHILNSAHVCFCDGFGVKLLAKI